MDTLGVEKSMHRMACFTESLMELNTLVSDAYAAYIFIFNNDIFTLKSEYIQ